MSKDDPILSAIMAARATMSASHARLADYILTHPLDAATMGIEDLANAAQVSIATVNRFVRKLGLSGYAEFKVQCVRTLHSALAPVEKLRERADGDDAAIDLLRASLDDTAQNLAQCAGALDPVIVDEACEAIVVARSVTVVGLGVCAPMAQLLGELLSPFCRPPVILDGWAGVERMTRRTMALCEGDLLVCLTIPRYSRTTVELAQTLKNQGVYVMAITDGLNSPVVRLADTVLLAPAAHGVLHGSIVALAALCEGLASALTIRHRTADEAMELTQRIYPHLSEETIGRSFEPRPRRPRARGRGDARTRDQTAPDDKDGEGR